MTTQMAGRWAKAAFLVVLGVLILLYVNRFVDDLKTSLEDQVHFADTWVLLTWLLWILVAWLFVDAALIIALSFSEHRYTLGDVIHRMEAIEKKLGITPPGTETMKSPPPKPEPAVAQPAPEEELPPPPRE